MQPHHARQVAPGELLARESTLIPAKIAGGSYGTRMIARNSGRHGNREPPPRIERELICKFGYFAADALERCVIIAALQRACDPLGDLAHLRLLHSARRKC